MNRKRSSSKQRNKTAGPVTIGIDIGDQLRAYGREVIVANVRELHAICRNDRNSDRVDAEKLARFARVDPDIRAPLLTEV